MFANQGVCDGGRWTERPGEHRAAAALIRDGFNTSRHGEG